MDKHFTLPPQLHPPQLQEGPSVCHGTCLNDLSALTSPYHSDDRKPSESRLGVEGQFGLWKQVTLTPLICPSSQLSCQRLFLTDEEKHLLGQEGVTLPSHLPLTKVTMVPQRVSPSQKLHSTSKEPGSQGTVGEFGRLRAQHSTP